MSVAKIGDLCEVRGELIIKWKTKTFSSVLDEKNSLYESPNFYFSGASWCLRMNPNGDGEAGGYIGLYLMRRSSCSTGTIDCTFGLITRDGGKVCLVKSSKSSFAGNFEEGYPKFITRSNLMDMKTYLIPSDELTISCSLKSSKPNVISETLFHRLELLSHNLKEVYMSGKSTDFTLKVKREDIPAHRMILETRSPVFAAMLNHDTQEKQTGEVSIEDFDKSTVDAILRYLYSGDIEKLETENVLSLYAAAAKYDIMDVKHMCVKFMLRNLSGEWLCDVIKFTNLYKEEEVRHCAKEYFINHSRDILKSEKWKTFIKESGDIALDFLGSIIQ